MCVCQFLGFVAVSEINKALFNVPKAVVATTTAMLVICSGRIRFARDKMDGLMGLNSFVGIGRGHGLIRFIPQLCIITEGRERVIGLIEIRQGRNNDRRLRDLI